MRLFASLVCLVFVVTPASATVTVITNQQQWQNAVGPYSSVTFVGFPQHTHITDQYSYLGILFTDDNNLIGNSPSYPSDGSGLRTGFGSIDMSFAQPVYSLSFDFIGGLRFELFNDGELIFSSAMYSAGFTPFVGIVSTEPFDAASARDYQDPTVAIDNIHFGPPIPAPSVIAALGLAMSLPRRRRWAR